MCKSQQKRWKEKYEGNPSMNSVTCTYHTITDSTTAYNTVLLCRQVLVGPLVAVPNQLHFLLNITDSPAILTVLLQNFLNVLTDQIVGTLVQLAFIHKDKNG